MFQNRSGNQSSPTNPDTPATGSSRQVEQNVLARQVLKAQERIQDRFLYNASLDAVYWITGASTICKHTNVRDETAIAQILTSEMWNCAPVQEAVESHLQEHQASNTSCQTPCLKSFCLKETSIYTKPTSVITSALSRYQKLPSMDVQEHLVAHPQKEEDLLRRRDPSISIASVKTQLYGSNTSDGGHETGTVEDSVIARILDSLRPTEPFLMKHLKKLELFRDSESWTLNTLINAIRLYERKMTESFHTDVASTDSAVLNHYKAKSLSRDEKYGAGHDYDFFDPTRYPNFNRSQSRDFTQPPYKKAKSDIANTGNFEIPAQIPPPSLMHSINRLSTVTESLHKLYQSSPAIGQASNSTPLNVSKGSGRSTSSHKKPRIPTHCIRCGSNQHLLWQCVEEDDDKAEHLRVENEKSSGFKPTWRYKQRGKSYAHTWILRQTLWPKSWLLPPPLLPQEEE